MSYIFLLSSIGSRYLKYVNNFTNTSTKKFLNPDQLVQFPTESRGKNVGTCPMGKIISMPSVCSGDDMREYL